MVSRNFQPRFPSSRGPPPSFHVLQILDKFYQSYLGLSIFDVHVRGKFKFGVNFIFKLTSTVQLHFQIEVEPEMESPPSPWTGSAVMLIGLRKYFEMAGLEIPDGQKELFEHVMKPTSNRFKLLSNLFRRIHTDYTYWIYPDESCTDGRRTLTLEEWAFRKFCQVSSWFGLGRDEAVKGTADPGDQYNFWINLLQTVIDLEEEDRKPIHNWKLLEELVIANTASLGVIRKAEEILPKEHACEILQAGGGMAYKAAIELDQKINLLYAKNPVNPSVEDDNRDHKFLIAPTVRLLKDFINSTDITKPPRHKMDQCVSAKPISNFKTELNKIVSSLEKIGLNSSSE